MTKRDMLSIAIKILGLYCVEQMVFWVFTLGTTFTTNLAILEVSRTVLLLIHSVICVVFFAMLAYLAYYLLRYSDFISKKLIPEDKELTSVGTCNGQKTIFTLALRICGVACLIKAIPSLSWAVFNIMMRLEAASQYGIIGVSSKGIIGAVVLVILGLYLISGGTLLVRFAFRKDIALELEEQ